MWNPRICTVVHSLVGIVESGSCSQRPLVSHNATSPWSSHDTRVPGCHGHAAAGQTSGAHCWASKARPRSTGISSEMSMSQQSLPLPLALDVDVDVLGELLIYMDRSAPIRSDSQRQPGAVTSPSVADGAITITADPVPKTGVAASTSTDSCHHSEASLWPPRCKFGGVATAGQASYKLHVKNPVSRDCTAGVRKLQAELSKIVPIMLTSRRRALAGPCDGL